MKSLIVAVIGLILVSAFVWYVQNDGTLITQLFKQDDTSDITFIDKKTGYITPEGAEGPEENVLSIDERTRITCTPEMVAQDCSAVAIEPVCSIDRVVPTDKGTETAHITEYISACHYCKFFGTDQTAEFGDQRVVSEGYVPGRCGK